MNAEENGTNETRAYMIIIAQISDRDAFLQGYSKATSKIVKKYGGRYIMLAPDAKLFEGLWGDGASIAISEWPNEAAIRTFWTSPEYAEAKKLRADICEAQVMVITAAKFTSD